MLPIDVEAIHRWGFNGAGGGRSGAVKLPIAAHK